MRNVLVLTLPSAEHLANRQNSTGGLESECSLCDQCGHQGTAMSSVDQ